MTSEGCGTQRSLLQCQLQVIAAGTNLRRAGQVVAWLEELAAKALDTPAGASSAGVRQASVLSRRFAAGQNLWRDTASRIQRPFQDDSLVSSIDPDSTSWCVHCITRIDHTGHVGRYTLTLFFL